MQPGHPECPERLEAINDRLLASGLMLQLESLEAPAASWDDLLRCHEVSYLNYLKGLVPQEGIFAIDDETALSPHTWKAAIHAAGSGILAVDKVVGGEAQTAFCAVRPPGHHAEPAKALGFCLFNNVCIAARYAQQVHGVSRIAVIDFDVHHGNGTEKILAGDDSIQMYGFFQNKVYPFYGSRPRGSNIHNTGFDAYTDTEEIRKLVIEQWVPAMRRFKPELILLSAGFDAHAEDAMSQLALYEPDYYWMTRQFIDIAREYAHGRVISILEGGYELSPLARSVTEHVRALTEG